MSTSLTNRVYISIGSFKAGVTRKRVKDLVIEHGGTRSSTTLLTMDELNPLLELSILDVPGADVSCRDETDILSPREEVARLGAFAIFGQRTGPNTMCAIITVTIT